MSANNNLISIILISSFISGCATTNKDKIIRNSLIAASTGIAYGVTRDEFKTQHSLMYGATAGLIAAITSLYYYDPDKEIKDLEAKLKFFDENIAPKQSSVVTDIPEEYRPLLESQTYDIYKINRWVRKGNKYLVKESELIEFTGRK